MRTMKDNSNHRTPLLDSSNEVQFPKKLRCLLNEELRYIILYGGRGGLKSWSTARALLLRGKHKQLRILCAREIQRSIGESVHQLLKDQIALLDLDNFYEVTNNEIRGRNGTLFFFAGLRHNIASIKSKEGIDVCWIEEAETVSKNSWDTLIPTIRKEGSQIIVSFNPDIEESETYQRYVVTPPENSEVVKTTYKDNPWFPQVLEQERLEMKEKDPVSYDNIWEGNPRAAVEGAVFEKEMTNTAQEGRITHVPYDPSKPVHTFWDLGYSDHTAIWFAQIIGFEYRLIRYYENKKFKLPHYIKYIQDQEYIYGTHYVPHDADSDDVNYEKTIKGKLEDALHNVIVVPRISKKALSIDAARITFPLCYFDKDLCSDGLTALRRYAYKVDEETGRTSKEPDHSPWSHGADAFQCLAMALSDAEPARQTTPSLQKRKPRLG